MARPLIAPAVSAIVAEVTPLVTSLAARSEERKIVDRFLYCVRRAEILASKSKMNAKRRWENVAARQQARATARAAEADKLLPLVEAIVKPDQVPFALPEDDGDEG